MLRLAVATNAETTSRLRGPLADRGIEVVHVPTSARTLAIEDGYDLREEEPRDAGVDVGFVFPPRLPEGGVADALLNVPWVNGREAVLRSRGKAEALARLDHAGVPTPTTVMVSNPVEETDLIDVYRRFDPPVVVKPNATTRGTGVAKAGDLDSFLGVVDYLNLVHDYRATADRSFLVQEYLPHARDFRVMTVEGRVVGAVERRLPEDALADGRWKHNVHRGAAAEGVDLPAAHRTLAEDAAATLDVDWLGVDLLAAGDRTVVNETNARPTVDEATKYANDFYDRLADLIRRTATRRDATTGE